MTQKPKKCINCGNLRPVFSKGRCKPCANVAYQKKWQANRKIKAKTSKTETKKRTEKKHKSVKDKEYAAMRSVWAMNKDWEGNCHCQECDKNLGSEMQPIFMAHILSKGANTAMRNNPKNFIILCPEHHSQYDNGKDVEKMKIYEHTKQVKQILKRLDLKRLNTDKPILD